jgi:putative Ca2+/H+ antiporter (TMEM165/GDT1 family)
MSTLFLSSLPVNAMDASLLSSITSSSWYTSFLATGFYQAFSLVFLSEIGDKTFFIAGLLAMKTSRFISFVGSMAALAVMTLISVLIGQLFHVAPSIGALNGIPLDDVAAVAAFTFFGWKTLKEALDSPEDSGSEVDSSLDASTSSGYTASETAASSISAPATKKKMSGMDEEFAEAEEVVNENQSIRADDSIVKQLIGIFALVFAAEFGDRSFLSTIALSAAQNPVGVAVGAVSAHAVATGIAVAGGAYVSKYIRYVASCSCVLVPTYWFDLFMGSTCVACLVSGS